MGVCTMGSLSWLRQPDESSACQLLSPGREASCFVSHRWKEPASSAAARKVANMLEVHRRIWQRSNPICRAFGVVVKRRAMDQVLSLRFLEVSVFRVFGIPKTPFCHVGQLSKRTWCTSESCLGWQLNQSATAPSSTSSCISEMQLSAMATASRDVSDVPIAAAGALETWEPDWSLAPPFVPEKSQEDFGLFQKAEHVAEDPAEETVPTEHSNSSKPKNGWSSFLRRTADALAKVAGMCAGQSCGLQAPRAQQTHKESSRVAEQGSLTRPSPFVPAQREAVGAQGGGGVSPPAAAFVRAERRSRWRFEEERVVPVEGSAEPAITQALTARECRRILRGARARAREGDVLVPVAAVPVALEQQEEEDREEEMRRTRREEREALQMQLPRAAKRPARSNGAAFWLLCCASPIEREEEIIF